MSETEHPIGAWASQAIDHWKEFQPTRYKELKKSGKLYEAAREAARLTALEMDQLITAGFYEHEAWEMVRENYLFLPEEEELKRKRDAEPCASDLPRLHVDLIRAMNRVSQALDDEEPQEEIENQDEERIKTQETPNDPTIDLLTQGGKLRFRDLFDE